MKELSGFAKWAHVLLVVAVLIVYALLFKETCYTVIDIWEIYAWYYVSVGQIEHDKNYGTYG